MRKKLVLFSSLLALPAVLATHQGKEGAVQDAVRDVFTMLPIDIWNTLLAFIVAAALINVSLNATNLAKATKDRRGFGLLSGAIGGTVGIFVYFTKFDFITLMLPFVLLLVLLMLFQLISAWMMPPDDPKRKERSRGTALLITGILLTSLQGAIVSFQEKLETFQAVTGAGEFDVAHTIASYGPISTLAGIIFIIWGISKIVSSFSTDADNPSFFGGLGSSVESALDAWRSVRGGGTLTVNFSAISAGIPITDGDSVVPCVINFNSAVAAGTTPYSYAWTFTSTGGNAPAPLPPPPGPAENTWTSTFADPDTYRVTLTVTDDATPALTETHNLNFIIL